MATAAFFTTISSGPGVGIGASMTCEGLPALMSHAARLVEAVIAQGRT